MAAGEPLRSTSADIETRGHAIECRINAEDPATTFEPNAGTIDALPCRRAAPACAWIRTSIAGYIVPPYYDSLLAKADRARGQDRAEAIARADRALDEFVIEGIKTTIPFHQGVLRDPAFQRAELSTGFIPQYLERAAGTDDDRRTD